MSEVDTTPRPPAGGGRKESRGRAGFGQFADVALPVRLHRSFTYGVPDAMRALAPGCRVWVRFGKRVLSGCVVGLSKAPPELPPGTQVQPILSLIDPEPVLGANLIALGQWLAEYYIAPPGEVFRAMMPPETPRSESVRYERTTRAGEASVRRGSLQARVLEALVRPMSAAALARTCGSKQVSRALKRLIDQGLVRALEGPRGRSRPWVLAAAITEDGRRALESSSVRVESARVLSLLSTATEAVPLQTIRSELGLARGPFRRLARRGLIELSKQPVRRSPWRRLDAAPETKIEVSLTEHQREALHRIEEALKAGRFHPLLLYGVTGSGKTEVYLRAVEAALRMRRSALLLVPEIALTPRLAGLLRSRFGNQVAILHSALGTGERRDEWWRVRRREATVVVGARAAVFAPIQRVGLVVVDEEHESAYKQEETPRYNARDVAIKRAKDEDAVIVLGSATPSLASYTHATEGRYGLARLPERIGARPLAVVRLVDMKEVVREEGAEIILSRPLREGLKERLAAGEKAIVLLNRRGYASQLVCRQCGLAASCSECSVALTLHRKGSLAVCHYCGLGRPTPDRCDVCQGEYLKFRGHGTEKVEEEIRALFPAINVARMDRDTMRRQGSHEALLFRFASGELDLLVGTQMLAKGHDFPAVTLVGVLSADSGLGVPDFRAAEKTFQLLTQVAGRAGRGDRPGEVLIQTFSPEHYALRHACAQDYPGFYEDEMRFRRGLGYPPVVALINLIFEAEAMPAAMQQARRAAQVLSRPGLEGVEVLGPAFAARSKVAGRYRCQVLLKLPRSQHRRVRHVLRSFLEDRAIGRAMIVDVDPQTLH